MMLQTRISFFMLSMLALLGIPIVVSGYLIINGIVYGSNERLLRYELETILKGLREIQGILEMAGIAGLERYVEIAQKEILEKSDRQYFGKTVHVLIFDKQGRVVWSPHGSSEKCALDGVVPSMLQTGQGSVQFACGPDMHFGVYDHFLPWGWLILAEIRESEIFSDRADYLRIVLFISIGVLFGVLSISYLFTRGTSLRIQYTLTALKKIERGYLSVRLEVPHADEIGAIQQGINAMAERNTELYHSLEQRVVKRTDSLVRANRQINRLNKQLQSEKTKLQASERELRTLIDNTPDTIARYDRDCRRIFVNPAFGAQVEGGVEALLGATPREIPGAANAAQYEEKIREVFATGGTIEFELKWPDRDGREICSLIRMTAEYGRTGEVVSVLSVGRDISELHHHRQQIYRMAFYDPLTALPNRASFNDHLRRIVGEVEGHGQTAALMLIDLDHFKSVNDTLGHFVGDALLREAASRLRDCVRSYDVAARLGGDEFAVLLPEARAKDELGTVADRILETFRRPFLLEGREIFVSGSIGIALCPEHGNNADDLLKQADAAMYAAKRAGRNSFYFYSCELMADVHEKLTLEGELRRSLERGELELHYQPKINLADGALIGAEALLRWNHPRHGMMLPDKFIPIAEERNLIADIDTWVLRNACRTAREWNGPGRPLLKMAINLSAQQFMLRNLADIVCATLEATGCPPGWIELEITESLLLEENDNVRKTLAEIREMGVTVAIDDFGTGYSALSYLARFPIDTLKIDRSFVSRISEGGHHAELVKAIILIARSLKQNVVAEGVETAEEAAFLQAQGCHSAQGYLYSQPISKSAFEALLEQRTAIRRPGKADLAEVDTMAAEMTLPVCVNKQEAKDAITPG